MAEVLFFHLERQPLEAVLPVLVQRSLDRDWRVVIQGGSRERLEFLDSQLWTFADDSFLPHGMAGGDHDAEQPAILTEGTDNPNGANVRILVDRAVPPDLSPYLRAVFIFDGHDPDAVAEAREQWKAQKTAGHELTYWQQNEGGGWDKKA
ncbi:DNA polymerase III subunit chi [Hartmannibacter diazotrophicus]|uniref:DNA polymerase III subunit chi n=1 Tax=Hartmannibacter diazotrophicus TaxID=1482074 RepID=A0A2C9D6N5_9HYPH|nr:DNA polymerase III subunit chi [Hartmannibacter diazotrophicus]SON55967.1 DNA polymerase III subunit chi [Hartmannibacter diazotrophicus]